MSKKIIIVLILLLTLQTMVSAVTVNRVYDFSIYYPSSFNGVRDCRDSNPVNWLYNTPWQAENRPGAGGNPTTTTFGFNLQITGTYLADLGTVINVANGQSLDLKVMVMRNYWCDNGLGYGFVSFEGCGYGKTALFGITTVENAISHHDCPNPDEQGNYDYSDCRCGCANKFAPIGDGRNWCGEQPAGGNCTIMGGYPGTTEFCKLENFKGTPTPTYTVTPPAGDCTLTFYAKGWDSRIASTTIDIHTCAAGQILYNGTCVTPQAEECNGIDDDYDGRVDEDLGTNAAEHSACGVVLAGGADQQNSNCSDGLWLMPNGDYGGDHSYANAAIVLIKPASPNTKCIIWKSLAQMVRRPTPWYPEAWWFSTTVNSYDEVNNYAGNLGKCLKEHLNWAPGETLAAIPYKYIGGVPYQGYTTSFTLVAQPETGNCNKKDNDCDGLVNEDQNGLGIGDVNSTQNGIPVPADYDGDKKTDLAIYVPKTGSWYIRKSTDNFNSKQYWKVNWGYSGTIPVPGDYDGDGYADYAVYNPGTYTWNIAYAKGTTENPFQWGYADAIPVPGDYDGDKKTDVAVYVPSDNGKWWVIKSSDHVVVTLQSGGVGMKPVPFDVDGDGKTDYVLYDSNPSSPTRFNWLVKLSTGGGASSLKVLHPALGDYPDAVPVPGDYDGDKNGDYAIYVASQNGLWAIQPGPFEAGNKVITKNWGGAGLIPVPGDYDGDKKTDYAVMNPLLGNWHIIHSSTGAPFDSPTSTIVGHARIINKEILDNAADEDCDSYAETSAVPSVCVGTPGSGEGSITGSATYLGLPGKQWDCNAIAKTAIELPPCQWGCLAGYDVNCAYKKCDLKPVPPKNCSLSTPITVPAQGSKGTILNGVQLGATQHTTLGDKNWTYVPGIAPLKPCEWRCVDPNYVADIDNRKCIYSKQCSVTAPAGLPERVAGVIRGPAVYHDPDQGITDWNFGHTTETISPSSDANSCKWTCAVGYKDWKVSNPLSPLTYPKGAVACTATCSGQEPYGNMDKNGDNFTLTPKPWTYKSIGDLNYCEWRCKPGYAPNPDPRIHTCVRYFCSGPTPIPENQINLGQNYYLFQAHVPTAWTCKLTGDLNSCEFRCKGNYTCADGRTSSDTNCSTAIRGICGDTVGTYSLVEAFPRMSAKLCEAGDPIPFNPSLSFIPGSRVTWICSGETPSNTCTAVRAILPLDNNSIGELKAEVINGNVFVEVKCSTAIGQMAFTLKTKELTEIPITIYNARQIRIGNGGVTCSQGFLKYRLVPATPLEEGKIYSITATIPQPCVQCSREAFFLFTLENKKESIPDTNLVLLILILSMAIFILRKKE